MIQSHFPTLKYKNQISFFGSVTENQNLQKLSIRHRFSHQVVSGRFHLIWLNCEQNSCDIYRSNLTAANLIPPGKLHGLTNSETFLYVLKYKEITTKTAPKSLVSDHHFESWNWCSGHAQGIFTTSL